MQFSIWKCNIPCGKLQGKKKCWKCRRSHFLSYLHKLLNTLLVWSFKSHWSFLPQLTDMQRPARRIRLFPDLGASFLCLHAPFLCPTCCPLRSCVLNVSVLSCLCFIFPILETYWKAVSVWNCLAPPLSGAWKVQAGKKELDCGKSTDFENLHTGTKFSIWIEHWGYPCLATLVFNFNHCVVF